MKLRSHNVGLAAILLRLIQLLTQIKYTEKRHYVDISKKVKEVVLGVADVSRVMGVAHVDKDEESQVRKPL